MGKFKLYFISAFCLLLCSCEREKEEDIANTFNCKINGELYTPQKVKNEKFFFGSVTNRNNDNEYRFYIATRRSKPRSIRLNLIINTKDKKFEVGEYPIVNDYDRSQRKEGFSALCYYNASGKFDIESSKRSTYDLLADDNGSLTITSIDYTTNKAIGIFNFKLKNSSNEVMNITDGKFNFTFIQ